MAEDSALVHIHSLEIYFNFELLWLNGRRLSISSHSFIRKYILSSIYCGSMVEDSALVRIHSLEIYFNFKLF